MSILLCKIEKLEYIYIVLKCMISSMYYIEYIVKYVKKGYDEREFVRYVIIISIIVKELLI